MFDFFMIFIAGLLIGDFYAKKSYKKNFGDASLNAISHPPEVAKNRSKNEYELISLDDAIVSELMRIRLDLICIKSKQFIMENKDVRNKLVPFSEEFESIFSFFGNYPYAAICAVYPIPETKEYGGIVILLDYIDDDLLLPSEVKAKTLRKIKSEKENKIEKGMRFPVYITDELFNNGYETVLAEVMSVARDGISYDITLKITLSFDYHYKEEELIRTITMYDNSYCDFVLDEDVGKELEEVL